MRLLLFTVFILLNQYASMTHAGNCFSHRMGDLCHDLTEADVSEDQCSTSYYSDTDLVELDGHVYAENCRDVVNTPTRCDVDCGLGEECQWINGEEMCVCSPDSCLSTDGSTSTVEQQPLCASNNMTFSSACAMAAWKCINYQSALYKKYDGVCQRDCRQVKCPSEKICMLVKNTGEPICYPKAHCDASADTKPVCGTNGVTYRNICEMQHSANRQGRTPDLAHRGACETSCRPDLCKSPERCVLSKHSRPVCILCEFRPRFFTHSGECSMDVSVCGDDGQLYENYCSILRRQCERNQSINIIEYQTCPTRLRKNFSAKKLKYFNRYADVRLP